jgi:membrane-associated phospholipid phosphatase
MENDSERAPDNERRPRRNPRAARTGFLLDYTLGIILGCLAVAGFIWIAIVVASGRLLPLDAAGVGWAQSTRAPQVTAAVLAITALGSVPTILLVLLLATVFLPSWSRGGRYRDGRYRGAAHGGAGDCAPIDGPPGAGLRSGGQTLLLWLAAIGGLALNILLKSYFSRPRPALEAAVYAGHYAFPSGHAMGSVVVYGTLAYLIVRGAPGRRALQALTILGAALVIILIGLSRIYLGVHYASDVLAGYLAGFAWADLCVLAYEVGRGRRRGREGP